MGLSTKGLDFLTAEQLSELFAFFVDSATGPEQYGVTLGVLSDWLGGGGTTILPLSLTAGEDLEAGAFVHVNSSGLMLNANASNPALFAQGYVKSTIPLNNVGLFYYLGLNDAVSVGASASPVWLSDSAPGSYFTSPPITAGHLLQILGLAIAGVGIVFQPIIEYGL